MFFIFLGIRQEQDIYVRLIDSVTKQVRTTLNQCDVIYECPLMSEEKMVIYSLWFTSRCKLDTFYQKILKYTNEHISHWNLLLSSQQDYQVPNNTFEFPKKTLVFPKK